MTRLGLKHLIDNTDNTHLLNYKQCWKFADFSIESRGFSVRENIAHYFTLRTTYM